MENTLIKLTLHGETKKRAHDSQIVRAKETLKLSHGGSSSKWVSWIQPKNFDGFNTAAIKKAECLFSVISASYHILCLLL